LWIYFVQLRIAIFVTKSRMNYASITNAKAALYPGRRDEEGPERYGARPGWSENLGVMSLDAFVQ